MKRDGDDLIRDIASYGSGGKRSYLSQQHIWSAGLFSRKAEELESAATQPDRPLHPNRDHRAFVIGAVLDSMAYLEASINEVFADAAEGGDGRRGLTDDSRSRLMLIWQTTNSGRNLRILEKYEYALLAAQKSPLKKGVAVYDNASCLVALRNALVHYSPEWHYLGHAGPKTQWERHHLERALSGKFTHNRLADACLPFFPDKCLGSGCAKWSVDSARAFYDGFREEMGLPPDRASEVFEWV